MELSRQDRFDILKLEMELIQSRLDKYDDLVFRNRTWFITLWMGTIGLGVTIASNWFPLFAVFLSSLFWFIEGMMRHQYWYQYVSRYRTLRDHINGDPPNLANLSLYDLSNQLMEHHKSGKERLRKSFLKLEPSLVYGSMALCSTIVLLLTMVGVIRLGQPA